MYNCKLVCTEVCWRKLCLTIAKIKSFELSNKCLKLIPGSCFCVMCLQCSCSCVAANSKHDDKKISHLWILWNYVVDSGTVKKRGGRKKRKKPLRNHHDEEQRRRNNNQREPKIGKLFEPLEVTSDDSEEAVAKELAEKLNEVRHSCAHITPSS